jgi:hypothetical protein
MKTLPLFILVCLFTQAHGGLIIYTFSGTGTGSFGATQFANSHFLITATADTSDVSAVDPYVSQILVQSATVEVDAFNTASFETGLRLFQGPYYSIPPGSLGDATVGLSLATGPDLLDLFQHAFVGYDLATALGPVFVPVPDYQSRLSFNNIPTSIGPMTLGSSLNVTFTATLVPEPSSISIFGGAVTFMVLAARNRKSNKGAAGNSRHTGQLIGL